MANKRTNKKRAEAKSAKKSLALFQDFFQKKGK